MQIYLYKFTKRPNSTKQPDVNDATKLSLSAVELKETTSFLNPTLLLSKNIVTGFNPVMYNYCYIPTWQRYYFIRDWRWTNAVWEADLVVDTLASFKTEIGSTSAYVLRASGDSNGNIIDTLYPAKTDISITKVNVAASWYNVAPSGGSYILGCINKSQNKIGSVTYYALTSSELYSIMDYLYSDSIFNSENIFDISEGFWKSLFNPFQYIVSCMWFPFNSSAFGSSQEEVGVGYWGTGVNGIIVSNLAQKTFVTATIPDHPQIARGAYLNHAPYTRITLYIPPFGSIPIDTNFIEVGNYLYSAVLIDHITGQATIRVSITEDSNHLDEYNIMTERSGMIGVPIQISQILTDYAQSVNSIAGGIQSLFTGNIAGLVSNALSAVESQMPSVTSSGANGSFIECIQYPQLIVEHLNLTDEDNTEFGRPLNAVKALNTLSGFIQTAEDDHAFSATESESKTINGYLKSGFFYE